VKPNGGTGQEGQLDEGGGGSYDDERSPSLKGGSSLKGSSPGISPFCYFFRLCCTKQNCSSLFWKI
jgi:hypothetical protein